MDDRQSRLESAIVQLTATVGALERRVAALETRAGEVAVPDGATAGAAAAHAVTLPRPAHDVVSILSLVGRLLIVLGGAYLLRAMTEVGTIGPATGIGAGLAFAAAWTVVADWHARRGHRLGAAFDGLATALIAFPLIWEATTRFHVLSPDASAAALGVFAGVGLAVSWRQRVQSLAWIVVCGALPTSLALIGGTGAVVPFGVVVILLGVVTLWMGYSLDYWFLRWPVAAVADIIVFGLTLRMLSSQPRETAALVVSVQLFLVAAYLVSIGIRTLVRGRNVIPFEVVQALAALVVGFGGAIAVTRHTGHGAIELGIASLVFGAACYGVTFAFIDRQQNRGRNVHFYASLAIVFALAGTALLLHGTVITITWAAFGMVAAWLWARTGRLVLGLHCAVYLIAAASESGTLAYGATAFVGSAQAWSVPSAGGLIVLAAASVCAWICIAGSPTHERGYAHVPRMAIILVLVWAAGAALIGWLARAAGGLPDGSIDPGILATVRTGVLAVSTLAVAWIGRHARCVEWGWLVYPLLVGIGLKMVAEDFMRSRPATLFLALALYGTALILAPRLRRAAPLETRNIG